MSDQRTTTVRSNHGDENVVLDGRSHRRGRDREGRHERPAAHGGVATLRDHEPRDAHRDRTGKRHDRDDSDERQGGLDHVYAQPEPCRLKTSGGSGDDRGDERGGGEHAQTAAPERTGADARPEPGERDGGGEEPEGPRGLRLRGGAEGDEQGHDRGEQRAREQGRLRGAARGEHDGDHRGHERGGQHVRFERRDSEREPERPQRCRRGRAEHPPVGGEATHRGRTSGTHRDDGQHDRGGGCAGRLSREAQQHGDRRREQCRRLDGQADGSTVGVGQTSVPQRRRDAGQQRQGDGDDEGDRRQDDR